MTSKDIYYSIKTNTMCPLPKAERMEDVFPAFQTVSVEVSWLLQSFVGPWTGGRELGQKRGLKKNLN